MCLQKEILAGTWKCIPLELNHPSVPPSNVSQVSDDASRNQGQIEERTNSIVEETVEAEIHRAADDTNILPIPSSLNENDQPSRTHVAVGKLMLPILIKRCDL